MTEHNDDTTHLDDLLGQARQDAPLPPGALMARVQTDAEAYLPTFAPRVVPVRRGCVLQVWQGLGGWPAIGGLVTATCAGVWLGINPPDSMVLAAETYLGVEAVTPLIDVSPEATFDFTTEAL